MGELRIARRLRAPSWRDGRLIVGVLLILASVALGARVVASANERAIVLAAARPLVPGDRLGPEHLTRVEVDLGSATETYLSADRAMPQGAVVVREVRVGELVPASALGTPESASRRPVMVPVAAESARVLAVGSVVDLWVSDKATGAGASYGPPRRLAEGAPVSRVPDPDEARLASITVGVQVMVSPDQVAEVIAAIDHGGRLTLVPAAGSLQRER